MEDGSRAQKLIDSCVFALSEVAFRHSFPPFLLFFAFPIIIFP